MDASSASIGIFDSGIGGLSVLQEICKQLPQENIIYFADTANFPYGTKTPEQIKKFSIKIASFLLKKNIKALVIACHTASAYAYETLQELLPIPVIDAVSSSIDNTEPFCFPNNHIAILATQGTVKSHIYQTKFSQQFPNVKLTLTTCPLLVSLVEKGLCDHPITEETIQEYIIPLRKKKIATLILGCTHFSFIEESIRKKFPYQINIINSALYCATNLKKKLLAKNILTKKTTAPSYQFFVSDSAKNFENYNKIFPKNRILNPIKIILD
jgi:glutamate racemase